MQYWWPAPATQVKAAQAQPQRHEFQSYQGYQLEVKPLLVGWQVIVTKDGSYVSNGGINTDMKIAVDEAHAMIDGLAIASVASI
jgi:hypothetical protein